MTIRVFKQFIRHLLVIGEKKTVSFLVQVSLPYALGELLVEEMGKHHKVWVLICHRYSSNLKYSRLRLRPSSSSVLLILYAIVVVLPYVSYGCYLLLLARKTPTRRWIFVDEHFYCFMLFPRLYLRCYWKMSRDAWILFLYAFVIFWKIPVVLQKMLTTQQTNPNLHVATTQVCGFSAFGNLLEMVFGELVRRTPYKWTTKANFQHQTLAVPWQDNRSGLISQQQPP